MFRRNSIWILLVFFLLAACGGGAGPETETTPVTGLAEVDSLEVLYLNTFPIEIQVIARGNLTDGCTSIDTVDVEREGETFAGTIETTRPADAVCTQVLIPFERVIPLEVRNLPAGVYAVTVNEAATTFELDDDNREPTEPPPDPSTASIRGTIWHDLCGTAGGVGDQPLTVTEGCVSGENGIYQGNGTRDEGEPGIADVQISLGEGVCPQRVALTSVSGEDGDYSFSGLKAGQYCIFVDPLQSENRSLLMPGDWTFPDNGVGYYDVELAITESEDGLDFAWDYDRLPPVNFEGCVDNAQFIQDISIPDDTILRPGDVFTKTWLIQNIGTCHWIDGYTLAYSAGDRLSGETLTLPTVLAGDEVEASVRLVAPDVEGEFRGDWELQNPDGERFGKVGDFDLTFFVKITVQAEEITRPAIQGTVWLDECDRTGGSDAPGCVTGQDGALIGNGILDEGEAGLEGVWVNLYQGSCPARGDSIASAITDEDGLYLFQGLDTGIYCVFIDALATENLPILGTGLWTHPALDVSTINVTLTADEIREEIDYGWYPLEE